MINFLGRPNDALVGAYKGQAQGFPQYLSRSVGFATHDKDVNLLSMEVVIKTALTKNINVLLTTSMDNKFTSLSWVANPTDLDKYWGTLVLGLCKLQQECRLACRENFP